MRAFTFCLMLTLAASASYSQNQISDTARIANKNIQIEKSHVAYKLYPTSNTWTFIKLNTRNGKLWQVQYNVDDDKRF